MKVLVIYTISNPGLMRGEQKSQLIDSIDIDSFASAEELAYKRLSENEKTLPMWIKIEQISMLQPEIENYDYEG